MKGKTDRSFIKHEHLWDIAYSQAYAYHVMHPQARMIGIDTHAGDGEGVEVPQMHLFAATPSPSTPNILIDIAKKLEFRQVVLCEKNRDRRDHLEKQVSSITSVPITVVGDNADVSALDFSGYDWALQIMDPCGYAQYNKLSPLPIPADYVLTFNDGALNRLLSMTDGPVTTDNEWTQRVREMKPVYEWMESLREWSLRLKRRYAARSELIAQSPEFRFRILVIANGLGDYIRRRSPQWEIFDSKGQK
jgi:hypothetical protein